MRKNAAYRVDSFSVPVSVVGSMIPAPRGLSPPACTNPPQLQSKSSVQKNTTLSVSCTLRIAADWRPNDRFACNTLPVGL